MSETTPPPFFEGVEVVVLKQDEFGEEISLRLLSWMMNCWYWYYFVFMTHKLVYHEQPVILKVHENE